MFVPLKVDLDSFLTTNVLKTFSESLGIWYHHVDVAVVVLGAFGVTVPGTVLGL